jgi:hypothetical protein
MGSEERESVPVAIRILHDFPPTTNAVTFLTVASKLAAMDIRVASRALLSDSRKNQLYVTLRTTQASMQAL